MTQASHVEELSAKKVRHLPHWALECGGILPQAQKTSQQVETLLDSTSIYLRPTASPILDARRDINAPCFPIK